MLAEPGYIKGENIIRSIRKVLATALAKAAVDANNITGQSINALPEYFLSIKVAEFLHSHFKSFTFSMEDTIANLASEFRIDISKQREEFRLGGKVDLTLRVQKSRKIKHVVEFKRNIGAINLQKDALRLGWICENSPVEAPSEKNFLVAVTHRNKSLFDKRTDEIKALIKEEFDNQIKVVFEPVLLNGLKSTRPKGKGKELSGGIWELQYRA